MYYNIIAGYKVKGESHIFYKIPHKYHSQRLRVRATMYHRSVVSAAGEWSKSEKIPQRPKPAFSRAVI